MSIAVQCDVCAALFEADVKGTMSLGVDIEGIGSWSDVDLCHECAERVIAIIRPALLEYPE